MIKCGLLKLLLFFSYVLCEQSQLALKTGEVPQEVLFYNVGHKKRVKDTSSKLENSIIKSKIEVLGEVLRRHVDSLKESRQVELVFLVDASASVGEENFATELRFVHKLLADFTVSENATRIAVITFSSKVITHADHITEPSPDKHKCSLLYNVLPNIHNSGGGTYTLGALKRAQDVLARARPGAKRAVFLITDGFSNGGDPLPTARELKMSGAMIFTFGIQNGNINELYEMASEPGEEYSYILDSFGEFLALVRRALHQDLKIGSYDVVKEERSCDRLCANRSNCCDILAQCSCGVDTGHYACICPAGYYGSGLTGSCLPCPNGTYSEGKIPGDKSLCIPCPDANHITVYPATARSQCSCKKGFVPHGNSCKVVTCPKLKPPQNGYFVKKSCGNVLNAACGIRCRVGFKLLGSSIRLCREDGTWSGEDPHCAAKMCPPPVYPENGNVTCSSSNYTVDTECHFSCNDGYLLVGSRSRNCLPLARWDGLQATCKPLFCPPLPPLNDGSLEPPECYQGLKVTYGTWCKVKCNNGFKLEGPNVRICGIEKGGVWSGGNDNNKCTDETPPILNCPGNITAHTDPGEDYATVNWTVPLATDNSEYEPVMWSTPSVLPPAKLKIGVTNISYVAIDSSLNQASCNFTIHVEDVEPPEIDSCESPSPFLSDTSPVYVVWDPPMFHDNSRLPVEVTVHPDTQLFNYGDTEVTYIATDVFGNNSTCIYNITVQENICVPPSDPINGHLNCSTHPNSLYCILTCEEGYAFAAHPRDFFCTYDEQTGEVLAPDVEVDPFPDCSVTALPNSISQDGVVTLDGETTVCQDPAFLDQLENSMKERIQEKLAELCGENELTCQVSDMVSTCDKILSSLEEESNIVTRRKRDTYGKGIIHCCRASGELPDRILHWILIEGQAKKKGNQAIKHQAK